MKFNTSNAFSSVRSRMSNFVRSTASDIEEMRYIRAKAKREKNVDKFIKFNDIGSFNTPLVEELYRMREPLASFAKKNGIIIRIFNPQRLDEESGVINNVLHEIGVLVSKPKKTLTIQRFDGNPSANYPKEQIRKVMVRIPGEEDEQVMRDVKSTINDNPVTHIFRALESMVKKVNY